jgi:hypothetical protein
MTKEGEMQARNQQEVQLLTDFRELPVKEQMFLMAYAASAREENAKGIPSPRVLIDGVNVGRTDLVR